jgi:hypothetical protein
VPYWLISTRHPDRVVAAIRSWDDVAITQGSEEATVE